MASNENQTLQVSLIIFVTLFVILAVTTFIFVRQSEDNKQLALQAQEEAKKSGERERKVLEEYNKMKVLIGQKPEMDLASIEASFNDDMKRVAAASIPEDQRFYGPALRSMADMLQTTQETLSDRNNEVQALKNEKAAVEAMKQTQVAAAEASAKKANDDLEARRAKFSEEDAQNNDEKQKLADDRDKAQTDLTTALAENEKTVKAKDNEIALLIRNLKNKSEAIEAMQKPSFEVADGEVRWVNQRNRSVWINLGSADGLRKQVTFSVHGATENIAGEQKPKGSIEVTDILDEHLAEAKIVLDDLTDPISPGDVVFTPLWQPGRDEHFALAGVIDLDGDREDDRDRVRAVISMAGGKLDAEVTPAGDRTDTPGMSVHTRYLILGDPPSDAKGLAAYTQIQRDAERFGIKIQTIEKFMDDAGWVNPRQLTRFGVTSDVEDIPADVPDGGRRESRGTVSELFRNRRPGDINAPRSAADEKAADESKIGADEEEEE